MRRRASSSRRFISFIVLWAVVLSLVACASAKPKPKPAPAPKPATTAPEPDDASAKKAEAKERFEKAMGLFEKKIWDAALAEFLASRAAYATRGNTQNAAICLRNLNRFDEALDMFEALLQQFGSGLSQPDRELVDKEIRSLRELVGTIEIRSKVDGAQVAIDGRERGTTPVVPLRIAAGTHSVRVFKQGFSQFEERVDVAGGQTRVVEPTLEPLSQSGRLSITEDGGKEADVVVDNVVVGKTPWQGLVSVGEHVVLLRGEGNLGTQPALATVNINQVTPMVLALEPLEASLRVEAAPTGATIVVDGVSVGSGVWDGRLRKGPHKIEVAQRGFLPQERKVELAAGAAQKVAIQLERDPNSPLWKTEKPARIFVEVAPSFPIALALGGELQDSCTGRCSPSFPLGVGGRVHGGYETPSGLGIGLDVGYLLLQQDLSGRDATLRPVGKPAVVANANDALTFRGLLVGGAAHLHRGEKLTYLFRLGLGAFVASASDTRSGDLAGAPLEQRRTQADLVYLYAAPEARIGYRLGARFEISAGVEAMFMVGTSQPRWDANKSVVAGAQGLALYDPLTLFGGTVFLLNPGLAARFDF